jgi:hypothetical protein
MNKRALMSLVLLVLIGTRAVFAQQPTLDKLKWGNVLSVGANYGSSTGKMQLVEAANKSISGTVVIPGTYNGNPVEAKNFANCANITSFIMLDGAVSISNGAFTGCTGLTSFTIPASVNVFGTSGFPGDLPAKYKAGGAGTYTREAGGNTWTKQ